MPTATTLHEGLQTLLNECVRVVMLTGDNKTTADAVARKLGITEVDAEILPEHKSEIVARLRSPPPMSASPRASEPTWRSRARA